MQISIVTALFNRLELTRACLESGVRALTRWDYEWILIDDGSTDGTRDFLRTLPANNRWRVVYNDAPRGFAANNNLGAQLARAPLLCLLNNDTFLLPGWLEPMARLARLLPDVACVGNVQREPFTGLLDHCGVYFTPEGFGEHAWRDQSSPPRESYLEWPAVTAACCVLRRKVFLELGGFDEGFRNGYEDVDFCLRATERGYRHFVANRSVIYHHVSASPGRRQHEQSNLQRFRERWQGRIQEATRIPRGLAAQRAEGRRYLRKHRWQPWRYNGWRLLQAMEKVRSPRLLSRRLEWAPRLLLEAREWQHGRRKPARGTAAPAETQAPPHIFMVVGDTMRTASRAGVPTVVRCLAGAFGRMRAPVRLILWQYDARCLSLLPPEMSAGLDAEALRGPGYQADIRSYKRSLYDPAAVMPDDPVAESIPLHQLPADAAPQPGAWILLPEVIYRQAAEELAAYVRRHGWRLAVIFHDAAPTNEPQFYPPGQPHEHAVYMRTMSRADLILPGSDFAAEDWRLFARAKELPQPPLRVCALAADTFGGPRRAAVSKDAGPATVRMLCVSTVEPRKNHPALLAAYERAAAARTDLTLELILVGAHRTGSENLVATIHETMRRHPDRIFWYETASYPLLAQLYAACDFTVFPSELEGLGMPIIESLWFARPCICANFGAMSQTATGGGCLTVDVRDPQALAEAILALAGSPERRGALAAEAATRPLRTWKEYAGEVLAACAPPQLSIPVSSR